MARRRGGGGMGCLPVAVVGLVFFGLLVTIAQESPGVLILLVLIIGACGYAWWERQRERGRRGHQVALTQAGTWWPESLTWRDLEELTAQLLRQSGWDAQLTAAADRGVDVIARRGDWRLCAQCKQQAAPVGGPAVQQFIGALVNHRAHRGVFVSPSGFTAAARQAALGHPVALVDRDALTRWANGGGAPPGC